jgi:hypothetical protein
MRVSEIIRKILDVIDQVETEHITPCTPADLTSQESYNDDVRRFRQIIDLASSGESTQYSNTPTEKYASVNSVTISAGGGVNGPKHPHDIRVKDPSMYPNQQGY